mmetsp:Transcript_26153/g.26385  ORF Transcript_26153/g.26385 Transcript_26153/m.26385 type:complete len:190 (-) Transcript_26153:227-796(-)
MNLNVLEDVYDCQRIVQNLHHHKINLLAIDFDKTLISIHTNGTWRGNIPDLCAEVRPFFRKLIPFVIDNKIMVVIVTFSPQVDLILEVMRSVFPEYANKIPIRGNSPNWQYSGKGSKQGKQPHIAHAAQELENKSSKKGEYRRCTTLLLDDCPNNIQHALENHTLAIQCDPDCPQRMIDTLLMFGPITS